MAHKLKWSSSLRQYWSLLFQIAFLTLPSPPRARACLSILWFLDRFIVIKKDTRLKEASAQQLYLGSHQEKPLSEGEDAFTLVPFLLCQACLPPRWGIWGPHRTLQRGGVSSLGSTLGGVKWEFRLLTTMVLFAKSLCPLLAQLGCLRSYLTGWKGLAIFGFE